MNYADVRSAPPRSGGSLQVEGVKTGGFLQIEHTKRNYEYLYSKSFIDFKSLLHLRRTVLAQCLF